MNPVIMHVNYGEITEGSFGGKTVTDICAMAADIGFDGIEFRGHPPKGSEARTFREYAGRIAAAKKECGLKEILFGISVKNCADPDAQVRKKAAAEAVEKLSWWDIFGKVFKRFVMAKAEGAIRRM